MDEKPPMHPSRLELKTTLNKMDRPLLLILFILLLFGSVMIFSATSYIDHAGHLQDPVAHFKRQMISMLIGSILAGVIFCFPKRFFESPLFLMLGNSILIVFLFYTLLFTDPINGARSWINFGSFSFQPSEFSKIMVLLTGSKILTSSAREFIASFETNQRTINLTLITMIVVQLFLIYRQPDKGMTILIFAMLSLLMAMDWFSTKILSIIFGSVTVIGILARFFINIYAEGRSSAGSYWYQRIISYPNPFRYTEDIGYQLVKGFSAISTGGWVGVGLGNSTYKQFNALPAVETDFILALIAEELGFIGVLFVFILYTALIARMVMLATKQRRSFESRVLLGFSILFFLQISINVGGLLGLIPLTGITLPFLSYGGSSMMMLMISMGFVFKLSINDD